MSEFKMNQIISKQNFIEFIKYGIVGSMGALVNLFVLFILTEFFLINYIISEIFAFIIASINNYIFDKIWTFREDIRINIANKYLKFLFINIIGLFINLLILYTLVNYFNIWYIFAEIIAAGFAFIFNYLGNKFWTFKNKSKI